MGKGKTQEGAQLWSHHQGALGRWVVEWPGAITQVLGLKGLELQLQVQSLQEELKTGLLPAALLEQPPPVQL